MEGPLADDQIGIIREYSPDVAYYRIAQSLPLNVAQMTSALKTIRIAGRKKKTHMSTLR